MTCAEVDMGLFSNYCCVQEVAMGLGFRFQGGTSKLKISLNRNP